MLLTPAYSQENTHERNPKLSALSLLKSHFFQLIAIFPYLHLPFRRKLLFFLFPKVLFGIESKEQLPEYVRANERSASPSQTRTVVERGLCQESGKLLAMPSWIIPFVSIPMSRVTLGASRAQPES